MDEAAWSKILGDIKGRSAHVKRDHVAWDFVG